MSRKISWIVVHSSPQSKREYHFAIRKDGVIEPGRPVEIPASCLAGYDAQGIHIAVAGVDDFRPTQLTALESLCQWLHDEHPKAQLLSVTEILRKKSGIDISWLQELWREWGKRGRLQ